MGQSLVEIVARNDFLGRPLGISVRSKAYKQANYRVYFLLALLWIDLVYSVAIALIPTENVELLLKLGDIPFHVLNKNRHFMTGVVIFYRLNPTVMVTLYCLDDFQWLRNSNRIYHQMNSPLLARRFHRLVIRCRTMLLVCSVSMGGMIVLSLIASSITFSSRNSQYNLTFAYLYILYFALVYTGLSCQFLIQLYLLCKICTEIFEKINLGFYQDLILFKRHNRFPNNLGRFSQMCYMVHNVNQYIRRNYVTYFVCSLPIIVTLFYTAFFSNLTLMSQAIYLMMLGYILYFLVFFSRIIGQIDVKAKKVSDPIYSEYIINPYNKYTGITFFQLSRYFQCVWNSTISLEVMGNPINSNTSLTILTILLTIIAFMIGNFQND